MASATVITLTANELVEYLKQAHLAHNTLEAQTGKVNPDWAEYYATFIVIQALKKMQDDRARERNERLAQTFLTLEDM